MFRAPNILPLLFAGLALFSGRAVAENPLAEFGIERLLLVRSKNLSGGSWRFPTAFTGYDDIRKTGYDNEIMSLDLDTGALTTVFRPPGTEMVGDLDLHWNADRLLFSMPDGQWHVHEILLDPANPDRSGTARRITPDTSVTVEHYSGNYAPDGSVVFLSSASYHAVPCFHGQHKGTNVFRIESDGTDMRMLTNDQAMDISPSVAPDGRVLFTRWNYTDTFHSYYRTIMSMNPDGTDQRVVAAMSSWWPPSAMYARAVPGAPYKIVAVASGHHGARRIGHLMLYDTRKGVTEAQGVTNLHTGQPAEAVIKDKYATDGMANAYMHPYPLDEYRFLVSHRPSPTGTFGIYLVDISGGTPVRTLIKSLSGQHLFDPLPYIPRAKPHQRPNRVKDADGNWLPPDMPAKFYIHDIYSGPGLAGVPRGTVTQLRVFAYNFGYPGLAGPNSIGAGGPYEVHRILGTVPVNGDGSVYFTAPAMTPISIQPLDAEGKAVQVFRSWMTARPGETLSCVGCHEQPGRLPANRGFTRAAQSAPTPIEDWYGPARGLDFERDVQPVLDRHCASCHQPGAPGAAMDLRNETHFPDYTGIKLPNMDAGRIEVDNGRIHYTPSYDELIRYVQRVGTEDQVDMQTPGQYHADTSPLIQLINRGHYGVNLGREALDRLVTWIDLNAPAHGRWLDAYGRYPKNGGAHQHRLDFFDRFGGPAEDPEHLPVLNPDRTPVAPDPIPDPGSPPVVEGWPFDSATALAKQGPSPRMTLSLGEGVTLNLIRIPAGTFAMGATHAHRLPEAGDWRPELPATEVAMEPFWIGEMEVTNAQYRRFRPDHRSGYFNERWAREEGPGLSLDGDQQPVVRVSWNAAREFCDWMSAVTGQEIRLPTEAEWEWAARAGTSSSHAFGNGGDFSDFANLADADLADVGRAKTGGQDLIAPNLVQGGIASDIRFHDGYQTSSPVGSFLPNLWSVHDMHGNAAEWTLGLDRPYPYNADDGRNDPGATGKRIIRGGSYRDLPRAAASAYRVGLPPWVRTGTVGFRVVMVPGGNGDTTPPGAPTGLTAAGGNGWVALNWDDNPEIDVAGYHVYRSTPSGNGFTLLAASVSGSEYTDSSVENGTTYEYVVSAVDAANNESARSAPASATPEGGHDPFEGVWVLTCKQGDGLELEATGDGDGANVVKGADHLNNDPDYARWTFTAVDDTHYRVSNVKSGRALTATGTGDRANVNQQTYTGADAQLWIVKDVGSGWIELENKAAGRNLESYGTAEDTTAQLYSDNSKDWQRWSLSP